MDFWLKKLRHSSQNSKIRVQMNLLGISFERKFTTNLRYYAKNLPSFFRSFSAALSKVNSTCPDKDFEFFLKKKFSFLHESFRTLSGIVEGNLAIYFPQGCQNCILRVQRSFLKKKIFSEKILIFMKVSKFWAKIFWTFVKTSTAGS